jgi:uncharacterized glyoxalase superfamily protein PhnB
MSRENSFGAQGVAINALRGLMHCPLAAESEEIVLRDAFPRREIYERGGSLSQFIKLVSKNYYRDV